MKKKITWSKSGDGYSTPRLTFSKKEFEKLGLSDYVEIEYFKNSVIVKSSKNGKKITWNKNGKGYLSPRLSFSKKEFEKLGLFDSVSIEYLEDKILIRSGE